MSRLFVRASSKPFGRRRSAVAAALGVTIVLCGCSPIATVSHHKAAHAPSSGANLAPTNQFTATDQRLHDFVFLTRQGCKIRFPRNTRSAGKPLELASIERRCQGWRPATAVAKKEMGN